MMESEMTRDKAAKVLAEMVIEIIGHDLFRSMERAQEIAEALSIVTRDKYTAKVINIRRDGDPKGERITVQPFGLK
jgi:hypothetical protein